MEETPQDGGKESGQTKEGVEEPKEGGRELIGGAKLPQEAVGEPEEGEKGLHNEIKESLDGVNQV